MLTDCTEVIKETKNSLWVYEFNFILQRTPTCFGHSCGHLQGGKCKSKNIFIVPISSLCKLLHLSPFGITGHHIYLIRISYHRTTLKTTVFNFYYLAFIIVLQFNQILTSKKHAILNMEWAQHTTNMLVFLHLPHWRWQHEWSNYYIIKLHS